MKRLDMGFTIEELCKNAQVELEVYCAIENNLTLNPGIEDLFYLFKGLGLTFADFDFKGYVSNLEL
ncbi:helix-turn-helix domain-containing protein [Ureibacillus xyleni]|nr:helix-turn-helix domain-containing protein [Ureibacillus xyleni]